MAMKLLDDFVTGIQPNRVRWCPVDFANRVETRNRWNLFLLTETGMIGMSLSSKKIMMVQGAEWMTWWVRGFLVLITLGVIAVLVIATQLNPYDETGQPLRMATHEQLGMMPCRFVELYQKPCPSCGLTTSFSLFMHGDLSGSIRANFVGTLMCVFLLLLIPWNLVTLWRGRYLWIRSLESASLVVTAVFMVFLLGRWGILLLWR
jgi:Protein of unknown function (DUF2752)